MHSDENDQDSQVLRLRCNDLDEESEECVAFLKEIEDKIFHEMTLKGINEISKVTFTKYEASKYYPTDKVPFAKAYNDMIEPLKQKLAGESDK